MLGFADPQIATVYILCILSALLCIMYGIINWNKGDEPVNPEDQKWVEGEKKVDSTL